MEQYGLRENFNEKTSTVEFVNGEGCVVSTRFTKRQQEATNR